MVGVLPWGACPADRSWVDQSVHVNVNGQPNSQSRKKNHDLKVIAKSLLTESVCSFAKFEVLAALPHAFAVNHPQLSMQAAIGAAEPISAVWLVFAVRSAGLAPRYAVSKLSMGPTAASCSWSRLAPTPRCALQSSTRRQGGRVRLSLCNRLHGVARGVD